MQQNVRLVEVYASVHGMPQPAWPRHHLHQPSVYLSASHKKVMLHNTAMKFWKKVVW